MKPRGGIVAHWSQRIGRDDVYFAELNKPPVKIFIGHAGERSRALAEELRVFVRRLVPATDPWVSTLGIEKGSRWRSELSENLEHAGAGIICLTADNVDNRWILFESGALSQKPADRVWTFLLDVKHSQVEPPLDQFQHTEANKDDVWLMIESINKTVETPRLVEDVRDQFGTLWPKLDDKIEELRKMRPALLNPSRSGPEMIVEVLEVVRDISRKLDSDRQRAALAGLRLAARDLAPLGALVSEHLTVSDTPLPILEVARRIAELDPKKTPR